MMLTVLVLLLLPAPLPFVFVIFEVEKSLSSKFLSKTILELGV